MTDSTEIGVDFDAEIGTDFGSDFDADIWLCVIGIRLTSLHLFVTGQCWSLIYHSA